MRAVLFAGLVACVIGGMTVFQYGVRSFALEFPPLDLGDTQKAFTQGSVVFVGDIMLARSVEKTMDAHGYGHPFFGVESLIAHADITVGNFEGSVPETHVSTPDMSFQFSVKDEHFAELALRGFDVLSLANNHTLDHGALGYEHTREVCAVTGITCGGHPQNASSTSTSVVEVGDTRVGIYFLHTLYGEPSREEVTEALRELSTRSDEQIVYIHWGNEYELLHSEAQALLARTLIDAGADAIIGHHPHVVQDVEIYCGKPVFYSLGNLIFDQYFSEDVQTGLAVRIEFTKNDRMYSLTPLSSTSTRSQPWPIEGEARKPILDRVLVPIAGGAGVDVREGTISLPKTGPLACS